MGSDVKDQSKLSKLLYRIDRVGSRTVDKSDTSLVIFCSELRISVRVGGTHVRSLYFRRSNEAITPHWSRFSPPTLDGEVVGER